MNQYSQILVTGGSGFIGSHLLHQLIKNYPRINIYNLDSLTYASDQSRVKELERYSNYHFIEADLRDRELISDLFERFKFDGVFHLAAESHVDNSIQNPTLFLETNIMGTANILEAARRLWLSSSNRSSFAHARFLHVSTDEVYGTLQLGETTTFSETTPYSPNSPYSASKAASDHLVNSYYHTYGLPVVITNCSNNYGPWQHQEKLIPTVINCLKNTKPIPVYGKGENVRDWLYVGDHCRALETVFLQGRLGEKYNIGGKNEKTNLELIYQLCDIMETLVPIKTTSMYLKSYRDLISFVTDRPGHDARYAIDNTKITTELEWQPESSFKEALVVTIKSYL